MGTKRRLSRAKSAPVSSAPKSISYQSVPLSKPMPVIHTNDYQVQKAVMELSDKSYEIGRTAGYQEGVGEVLAITAYILFNHWDKLQFEDTRGKMFFELFKAINLGGYFQAPTPKMKAALRRLNDQGVEVHYKEGYK